MLQPTVTTSLVATIHIEDWSTTSTRHVEDQQATATSHVGGETPVTNDSY
jgi:hypothetical protein